MSHATPFNGLLAYLADTGKRDATYAQDYVNGLDAAIAAACACDPADSGVNAQELTDFFALWTQPPKVVTAYSQGVNQSVCGT
ncbi:hypothetical protein [Sulfitobacter sp.]|uniref:hypothetical protein n=1 Tax=Sulfitobacter sp. TaxID=1903071 RepID=UPI00300193A0